MFKKKIRKCRCQLLRDLVKIIESFFLNQKLQKSKTEYGRSNTTIISRKLFSNNDKSNICIFEKLKMLNIFLIIMTLNKFSRYGVWEHFSFYLVYANVDPKLGDVLVWSICKIGCNNNDFLLLLNR